MTTNSKKPIPVAILVRVSTRKQETDRQVSELEGHAATEGYEVVEVCREQISGAASREEREGINQVLELARARKIKKVLVHEVSRIARKNSIAHQFLEELEDLGVSLYWHSQSIETLLSSGRRNPAASIMFSLLAEMARAEREVLRERIKSGLREAAKKGRYPGRPKGSTMSEAELLKKYPKVVRQLHAGQSVRNTASICAVSKGTVERVRKATISAK
ncbi:recombinase family protein [Verrucomicrobiales bacterium BCK34]|nr:recombinase family protein [Verrucomicrobiales bacterium BCK34]